MQENAAEGKARVSRAWWDRKETDTGEMGGVCV